MIYDKKSYDIMKYIEDTLQTPIVGIKTDDFEAMEKVSLGTSFACQACTYPTYLYFADAQERNEEVGIRRVL